MAAAFSVRGTAASPGRAVGPVYLADDPDRAPWRPADEGDAHAALAHAIRVATADLQRLAAGADPDGAAMLEFQIEVLGDPTINEATTRNIDAGDDAALAWAKVLDHSIREIGGTGDGEFRARAIDIQDIRNRVLDALRGTATSDFPPGAIYVGRELEPSRFLSHDWSAGGGIVLFAGSPASHVALLARGRAVPMIVGTGPFAIEADTAIAVDGHTGVVSLGAEPQTGATDAVSTADPPANGPVRTADGIEIQLSVNIGPLSDIETTDAAVMSGVGLFRSEFAIAAAADLADEDRQVAIYRRVLEWAGGKPVSIRMFDFGGDKPMPGTIDTGSSPGLRGIRLLFARPQIARVQARALLRAAAHGDLRILLPMVTFAGEVEEMTTLFRREAEELSRQNIAHRMAPIGMMVEVPAAALMLETFAAASFFSVGSNDLAQYLVAAGRNETGLASYHARSAPVVLSVIATAVGHAARLGRPIALCGAMAGEPDHLPGLLASGLRHFSVAPASLAVVRSELAALNADGTKATGD